MEWYVAQDGRYTTVDRQAGVDEMLRRSQELAAATREDIAHIRLMLEFATICLQRTRIAQAALLDSLNQQDLL